MMKKKRWHIMPRNVEKENTLIRELGVKSYRGTVDGKSWY